MALNHRLVFADEKVIICVLCFIQFVVYSIPYLSFLFVGTSDSSTSLPCFSESKGEFTFSSLVLNVLDWWLEFLTKDYAISCLSAGSRSFGRSD